jgi:hypothetical protein
MNMLSDGQIYIVSTHLTLYLWLGRSVNPQFKKASLRMLKSFMQSILKEKINYVPNYIKNLDEFRQSMDLNGANGD